MHPEKAPGFRDPLAPFVWSFVSPSSSSDLAASWPGPRVGFCGGPPRPTATGKDPRRKRRAGSYKSSWQPPYSHVHIHTDLTDIQRARWSICFGLNGNFIKKWEPPAREIRNFQSVRCLASGFWGFFFWLLLVSVGLGFCTGSSGFQKLGGRCCVSCGRWAGGGGRGTVLEMSWHEA